MMGTENNERQVAIRAEFDGIGKEDDDEESEDDEDFDPAAEDDVDLEADTAKGECLEDELRALQSDLQHDEEEAFDSGRRLRTRSRKKSTGLGLEFFGSGTYHNPLLDQYSQDEPLTAPPAHKSRSMVSKGRRKVRSSNSPRSILNPQNVNRRDSAGSIKSVRFEDGEAMTPATVIEAREDDEEEDDEDFLPAGLDGSIDLEESDKENTEPMHDAINPLDTSDSSSSSSSDLDHSENESGDTTSSSGKSSSDLDSDSDAAPDQLSSKVEKKGKEDDDSSSSSPTSRSGSDPRHGKRDEKKSATDLRTPSALRGKTSAETEKRQVENPPVPPGGGKQTTKIRNIRRKASAALKFHKAKGDLHEDATPEDLIRLKEQDGSSIPPWMKEMRSKLAINVSDKSNDKQKNLEKGEEDAFEIAARRDALLSSLQSEGGIDVSIENKKTEDDLTCVPDHTVHEQIEKPTGYVRRLRENGDRVKSQNISSGSKSNSIEVLDSIPKLAESTSVGAEETQPAGIPSPSSTPPDASGDLASVPSGSQRRRTKLDLAGSKRLLFGSLGLKAPKTKDDEAALREKLMKDVRPVKPVRDRVAEIEAVEAGLSSIESGEDKWMDRITLAAVECCHDGIELSTPPFPFVQRWDPQQQGTYSKKKEKRNRKRKRIDQSFDEGKYDDTPRPGSPSKVARHEDYDLNVEHPQFAAAAFAHDKTQQTQQQSHDQYIQDSAAANQQLLRETSQSAAHPHSKSKQALEAEEPSDLPSLPDDLTEYQQLEKRHCSVGAIIAFKKFLMSAETGWQPGISGYLTAAVDELKEDGTVLVTLAKRDQPKSGARYHEQTGERLYSKFEMPGFDEDASNDSQRLEMPFDELISPLLIRRASSNQFPQGEREVTLSSKPDDTIVGDEAQRPIVEAQTSLSFDSNIEDPLHSAAEIAVPTESARQEIVEMIQNAGWRSSIGSGVGKQLDTNGHAESPKQDDGSNGEPITSQSSKYEASGASAYVNGIRSASSPLAADFQPSKNPQTPILEIGHSKPGEEANSSVLSTSDLVVQYPNLPYENNESELFQDQRQHRSVSMDDDLQSSPQNFISPPPIRRGGDKAKSSATGGPVPIRTLDGAEDSDEFPELFSEAFEARMSQEPTIKNESTQKLAMDKIPKQNGKFGASRKLELENDSWNPELSGADEEDDTDNVSSFYPSQSQVAQSSQVVDLTMSSDHVEPMLNHYEGVNSYNFASGWMDKPKVNKDLDVAKRSSRKTRSTSAVT